MSEDLKWTVHKRNTAAVAPKVSIVLLDWSCRESFHALDWLNDQTVPRDSYELIWVELFDRVVPEVMEKVDAVITCGQKGLYHKHVGYNIGVLESRGTVVTVCDSDAVFPRDFIASIVDHFQLVEGREPVSKVLMHYEWRTNHTYPEQLTSIDQLSRYRWLKLWENVGACMSVLTRDAIRYGGFDEHRTYRGYMCGPYDLGWRMVNAGVPEVWQDPKIALWHFAHDNPLGNFGQAFSYKLWREAATLHIVGHALTAVEAFSTGRILPLKENRNIFDRRMAARRIGTPFEAEYSLRCEPEGFSWLEKQKFRFLHVYDAIKTMFFAKRRVQRDVLAMTPILLSEGFQRIAFLADDTCWKSVKPWADRKLAGNPRVSVLRWNEDASAYDIVVPLSRDSLDLFWLHLSDATYADRLRIPDGKHHEFEHVLDAETRFRRAFAEADRLGCERIAIFPAGQHSRKSWRILRERLSSIACFLDAAALPGQTLFGKPVLRPEGASDIDAIILSSDQHEEKLWQATESARVKGVPVLRLYSSDAESPELSTPVAR